MRAAGVNHTVSKFSLSEMCLVWRIGGLWELNFCSAIFKIMS